MRTNSRKTWILVMLSILFMTFIVSASNINFTSPTLANNSITGNRTVIVNASITLDNALYNLEINWNGTNYSVYNNSLVLMYGFNNNSLLGENTTYQVDASIYSNNATCTNSTLCPSFTTGKYLRGIQVNSTTYPFISSYNPVIINQTTVSFWFSSPQISSKLSVPLIEHSKVFWNQNQAFLISFSDSSPSAPLGSICVGQNNGGAAQLNFFCTSERFDDNSWHYISIVMDRSQSSYLNQSKIYVDGVERTRLTIGTYNLTMNTSFGSYPIFIGGRNNTLASAGTNISLDEVRVWNISLQSEQIQQNYFSNLQKYNATQWFLSVNQSKNYSTQLSFGNYSYFLRAIDTIQNIILSELRQIRVLDIHSPTFSNLQDNSNLSSFTNLATFNATIINTNGTVFLAINNLNITPTRNGDIFSANTSLLTSQVYSYIWYAYSNDSINTLGNTQTQYYYNNLTSSVNYQDTNSICLGDIYSPQWAIQYTSQGYVPKVIANYLLDDNFGYLSYVNPNGDSGSYGVLTYKIVTPPNATSLNFTVPMKLPEGVINSTVSISIYNTQLLSSLSSVSFNLTNTTKPYSVNYSGVLPNKEYNVVINVNSVPATSSQAKALIGKARCTVNSTSEIINSSYTRLELSNSTVLNDVDNVLTTRYPQTSQFGRYAFNTNSTLMLLEIASNYVFAPSIANIAIKVNGANYLTVSSTSTNNNLAMYNVTLPIGDKYIEIINGEQSLASLTPPVQGTWVRSVYVPSSSYLTYNNSLKSQKLLIYGDSIAGGGAIVSPPLNAWTSLFRNNTNLDLTVYAYGWRNLQYDVANVGISTMTNNILKVSPNIIYLAIGTNDYGLNRQSANNFGIQYGQLIDSVHSSLPNATIYAQTPLNRSTETANTFGNTLQDYRDQIISVVVSRSYVKLVNGTQILSTSDMDDGLHPNFAGNIKYFNYVNSLINDNYYPIFSNYTDNNEALKGSGLGTFNVNLLNSNGTVWLNINGTNITAINQSMLFFANYSFTQAGVYSYRWYAYGNGSSNLLNQSEIFNYTVQESTSNSTNLPNGGSGGWYLNKFNETIMCDFTYSFLVDKIAKTGGRNYSNEELNNLTAMINVQMRVKTDNSTAKLYLDNFEKKCGNKLPKKRAETNGTKLIDYTSGISPCTPDINSTFTLLNAKFNMDSNIPFFNIEIGRANCVSIESLRWLFKIEKAQDRYTISGIKLWWVLVLSVILVISLIYRHSRKSQRPQMPRHRR